MLGTAWGWSVPNRATPVYSRSFLSFCLLEWDRVSCFVSPSYKSPLQTPSCGPQGKHQVLTNILAPVFSSYKYLGIKKGNIPNMLWIFLIISFALFSQLQVSSSMLGWPYTWLFNVFFYPLYWFKFFQLTRLIRKFEN